MKNSFLLFSRLRVVLLTLAMLSGFSFVSAQTKTISGTVTAAGLPIPGINVKVKGGSAGAVTDFDGLYTIDASVGEVLQFSSIGFVTQSIKVGDVNKIDVALVEDVEVLDDVVVIGYGKSKRKDLTGSIVSVKAEEIEKVQAVSFEQALVGRAAGVQITSSEGGPGAGLKVRVRGSTSLLANSEPLYVIDGFPIIDDSQNDSQATGLGQSFSSPLDNLDPSIIASVDILKDAAATAIYGVRGANGVVIITTKSGKKGKPSLTFDTSIGVSRIGRHIDLLGAQDYINLVNDANLFVTQPSGRRERSSIAFRDDAGNPISLNDPEHDLFPEDVRDLVFRDGILQKHTLSVRGGSDKVKYSATFGYLNQEGTIRASDFTRYTANLRTSSNVNDKLKVNLDLNASLIGRGGVVTASPDGNGTRSGIVTSLTSTRPVQGRTFRNLVNEDGTPINVVLDATGRITSENNRLIPNPLQRLAENFNESNQVGSRANLSVEYKLLSNLTFKSRFGGRTSASKRDVFNNRRFGFGFANGGIAQTQNNLSLNYSVQNTLTHRLKISKHSLVSLLGQSQNVGIFESARSRTQEFATDEVNIFNLSEGTAFSTDSNRRKTELNSFFTRFNYNYSGKYYFSVSGRSDQSSRFVPGSQQDFFYAASTKWSISKESFFKPLKSIVSKAELKASWGVTGNDRIPFGNAFEDIRITNIQGAIINRLRNRELTWEKTSQFDAGLTLGFFKNRLNIQADYFEKSTEDLLYFLPVSADLGLSIELGGRTVPGFFTNLGEITNRGLELAVGYDIFKSKNFKWNANFNITFSNNEINSLGPNGDLIIDSRFQNRINNDVLIRPGEELGAYFGYQSAGVYKYSDFVEFDGLTEIEAANLYIRGGVSGQPATEFEVVRRNARLTNGDTSNSSFTLKPGVPTINGIERYRPGLRKYVDQNGDGEINIDDDKVVIGRALSDHFGGFSNSFSYKNIDLSFLMNWSYGNDVYNKNLYALTATHLTRTNKVDTVLDRWTPFNNNTNVPSIRGNVDVQGNNNITADDTYIEDGSYLRLANISFSYKINKKYIEKLSLKELKLYGAVDNVYVWTNYSGADPDVSVGNNQLTPGIDFDAYPRARTFRFGVKATF